MKKILLTTAALAAFSTSTFAESYNQFFITGGIDGSYFRKFNVGNAKVKQTFTAAFDLGAGYSIMDNLRADVIYTQPFSLKMKSNVPTGSVKPSVRAVFARLHGDIIDLGIGRIFLTGGLGFSQVKATYSASVDGTSSSIKSKNKNNIAWTAGAGIAFDFAEGVHLDVAYSYREYGKTKKATIAGKPVNGTNNNFNSHNGTIGIRFDI